MALWVDRCRAWRLEDCVLHPALNIRLCRLARQPAMGHLLFYGPSGAGKRTRILCFLREMFGEGVLKAKISQRTFKVGTNSKRELVISTLHSNYHIELNPSDVGAADRYVIQTLFREIAETSSVRPTPPDSQPEATVTGEKKKRLKVPRHVVVINGADRLSREAQAALRRTMEKYSAQCSVILCCESLSRIIDPVQSRCQLIRVPAPAPVEIAALLCDVAKREKINVAHDYALNIAHDTDRDVRQALLTFQASLAGGGPKKSSEPMLLVDWQSAVLDVASMAVERQSVNRLNSCREKLLELLAHQIPADLILRVLIEAFYRLFAQSEILAHNVVTLAADCDLRLALGTKPIFHLDLFIAKIMTALLNTKPEALQSIPRVIQSPSAVLPKTPVSK
jgi:replication factor C subunit 3/5